MRVMGLDLATNCGVAIGDSGGKPESFSVCLKRRGQTPEVAAFNMLAFLRDFLVDEKPDLVCIEQYLNPAASKNADSTILLLMVYGVATSVCASHRVRVETVSASTARKHFCGRANASDRASTKRMVLDRAKLLGYLPPDCDDDNRGDALAVWDFACAKYGRVRPEALVLFGARS